MTDATPTNNQALSNLLQEYRRFEPPRELADHANVGAGEYDIAAADPVAFWETCPPSLQTGRDHGPVLTGQRSTTTARHSAARFLGSIRHWGWRRARQAAGPARDESHAPRRELVGPAMSQHLTSLGVASTD